MINSWGGFIQGSYLNRSLDPGKIPNAIIWYPIMIIAQVEFLGRN